MTLQDLRYLVALVDHGHFGRAAEACHVSQPTLSMQVKKVERQLGLLLFERNNKSVHATAAGTEVVRRARQILGDVEMLGSMGRQMSAPLAGAFGLGVIPTLGPYLLPWLVPALKRNHPELRLSVREDLTAHLLDRLASHRLDAALVALPVSDERVKSLALFDEPFWFAEPAGQQPAVAKTMSEEDLRGKRLLLLTEGHCLRDQALSICGVNDRDADGDFRATSLETIRQMVATGLGSTLLPAMACGVGQPATILARPLEAGVGRRIGLVWRRRSPRTDDCHLFARTLLDHLPDSVYRVRAPEPDER